MELLPTGALVLEILEDQTVDEEVIAKVSELKLLGHRFALDDFELTPDTERLLGLVEFVKLDLLALGREGLVERPDRLKPYGVHAGGREKLETYQDQAFCAEAGCDLFQGYFFCRPELIAGRRIDANRAALLELLSALHDPDVELADLHRSDRDGCGLCFRLMRYINSPFFGLRMRVGSIGQAVALLGFEQLKQWITLTLFMGIDDQPTELTVTALVRARFCESRRRNTRTAAAARHVHARAVLGDRRTAPRPDGGAAHANPVDAGHMRGADRACRPQGAGARLRDRN